MIRMKSIDTYNEIVDGCIKKAGYLEAYMKKLLKKARFKVLSIFVIGISIVSLWHTTEAKALTRDAAIAWLREQVYRDAGDCDTDNRNRLQCVDLVTAWMNYLWLNANNISEDPWQIYPGGDGYTTTMAYNYDNYCSDNCNWTVIERTSTTIPQPGDIFVSEAAPGNWNYGHVGIVLSASDSTGAEIIEMHGGDENGYGEEKPHIHQYVRWNSHDSYNAEHFIRFNYYEQSVSEYYIDLNWYVDNIEVFDPTPGTVDVYINGKLVEANATDYYSKWPAGTTYEFKNLKTKDGYKYEGVKGDIKGELTNSDERTYFAFTTVKEEKKNEDSSWKVNKTGTHYYCSIPNGFDSGHNLYSKYSSEKLTSYEKENYKLEVSSPTVAGYIYYHWTHNCYELPNDNYNVFISPEYKWENGREYYNFRAFYSSGDAGHTDKNGVYGGDDVYYYWGNNYEDGSWWWFRIPLYKQEWTDYVRKDDAEPTKKPDKVTPTPTVTPKPTATPILWLPTGR